MPKLSTGFIKQNLLNGALLLLSAIPFTLFAYRAAHVNALSGLELLPLATLVEGTVEKREAGHDDLKKIEAGEIFYDHDAVWVGPSKKARLKLISGKEIQISENSSVVFRQPFGDAYDDFENTVDIIQGEVVTEQKTFRTSATEGDESEAPKDEKITVKNIFPPDNALFYYRPGVLPEVIFSAGDALAEIIASKTRAILVLKTVSASVEKTEKSEKVKETQTEIRYFPLPDDGKLKTGLNLNQRYIWQVIDANKKIIAGPYPLEIRSLAVGDEAQLLKDSVDPSNRPVLTFW